MTGFGFSSTAEEVTAGIDLRGKTVVITGCNSGIGAETARVLGRRGAFVIGCARTAQKASAALDALGVAGTGVACDLSEPASVRAAVASIVALGRPIDVVVCNAGIMALPERQQRYGVELQLLTNHVGHFLFATGLVDHLTDDGRVVVVSSRAHFRADPVKGIDFDDLAADHDYGDWKHYGQSKLANILFARELHRRFQGTRRVASSLHPGVIKTNLGRHNQPSIDRMFASMDPRSVKTIPQGAATTCFLAAHPDGARAAGGYYADCAPAETSAFGRDDALAARLWAVTEALAARL